MSLAPPTAKNFLYKLHRWGGMFLAVFVLFYSSTGIFLNHRQAFGYFTDTVSTFQEVTPADPAAVSAFIDHYKQQIQRRDDPKIIRIREDNRIEFLYGSHGKTTYIIDPVAGRMETVSKHTSNPLYFINSLHKASGTSTFWVIFTDLLAALLIAITIASLVSLRYKALDLFVLVLGLLLCFMGGYFA